MNRIEFYDPKKQYGIFSNYHATPVVINGIKYATTEHYFQAMKFMGPNATSRELEYSRLIASQNTPNKAKILAGQKVKGGYKWRTDLNPIIQQYQDVVIRSDWEEVKYNVMRAAVMNKFLQNPDVLLSTGDAVLVEASPKDYIWGIGKDGSGKNALGIILMETRYVIRGLISNNQLIPGLLFFGQTPGGPEETVEHTVYSIGLGNPIVIYNDDNAKNVVVEIFKQLYQIDRDTSVKLVSNYR